MKPRYRPTDEYVDEKKTKFSVMAAAVVTVSVLLVFTASPFKLYYRIVSWLKKNSVESWLVFEGSSFVFLFLFWIFLSTLNYLMLRNLEEKKRTEFVDIMRPLSSEFWLLGLVYGVKYSFYATAFSVLIAILVACALVPNDVAGVATGMAMMSGEIGVKFLIFAIPLGYLSITMLRLLLGLKDKF